MIRELGTDVGRAYATIFFVDRAWIGWCFVAATFVFPQVGAAGLLAAVTAVLTAYYFSFPARQRPMYAFNSALVGLSIGAFFTLDAYTATLVVFCATFAVFATATLGDALWRFDRLPTLSMPFVLVATLAALIAHTYSGLRRYDALRLPPDSWFGNPLDTFFETLGAALFAPHPLAGAILFAGIVWRSRYLALLGIAGFLTGFTTFGFFTNVPDRQLMTWSGFNFVLTAMAIGGVFMIPSIAAFVFAIFGAALSALLCAAFMHLALTYQLPVMVAPFLITTLTLIVGLRRRIGTHPPWLAPEPGMPEANFEAARLASVRTGDFDSLPLLTPFYGEWRVYQGFLGQHTHQPPWQHALDFFMTEDGRSYRGAGTDVEDFHCWNVPVVSPAHGDVVRVQDGLPDNRPGDVDTHNNWGNFVLIRVNGGLHVLLAHLRQGSVCVKEGQHVTPGVALGRCGNSGRSPQPHLHLQVQREAALGGPTHPFHLCSVLVRDDQRAQEYLVSARPETGQWIQSADADAMLAACAHLPVGRQMSFTLTSPVAAQRRGALGVSLSLLGSFQISSNRGAIATFEETNGVLAFYARRGPRDRLLDVWMIALGLTPLTERAHGWKDSPSIRLFPLTPLQRVLLSLLRPLGCGAESRYERRWVAAQRQWTQTGRHALVLGPMRWTWTSEAIISAEHGYISLTLEGMGRRWNAVADHVTQRADQGIPERSDARDEYKPARRDTA